MYFHTGSRDVPPLLEMSHINVARSILTLTKKLRGLCMSIGLYGLKEISYLTLGTTWTSGLIPDSYRQSTQKLLVLHPIWKNIQSSLKSQKRGDDSTI